MVGLTPFLSGDTATPHIPKQTSDGARIDPGPYLAIVKSNIDPTRMGRLSVLIPSLANTYRPSGEQLIVCDYLSPFYGAKTTRYLNQDKPYDYKSSQHSYGMWMVPPDIDTKVLVIFAEGKIEQAYWIGCVQDPLINHMVPGIAATELTGLSEGVDEDSKESVYGTSSLPAGEVNRTVLDRLGGAVSEATLRKPIHPFAETLRRQGLIQDTVRGTTTSSARRESPSQVFGFSTPGRRDPDSRTEDMGVDGTNHREVINRLTGHTFVMDDGDASGRNQLVRLRSASGHQILLNDTAGVVYIANGSGNAWMNFHQDGSIDLYSASSVAVRSSGNMDFHSDANINMFAKEQIKFAAGQKLVIDGGQQIMTYADYDILNQSLKGSVTTKAPEGAIISYAGAMQLHMSGGQHHLTGSQVHFNSMGTRPDLISTFYRTRYYDQSGTGTLNTPIPDVDITKKLKGIPLKVDQNLNISVDGMRVPTHEPFWAHRDKIVSFVGGKPSTLGAVPGTPEFISQLNRTHPNAMVRAAQMQADMKVHLEGLGLSNGTADITKLQSIATNYIDNYAKDYNLPASLNLSQTTEAISSIVNQTVGSITGEFKNLLQNQIFVNQGGNLFTAGNLNQAISGTVSGAIGDLTSVDRYIASAGNVLKANLPESISGLGLNNITSVPSSISNITGITQGINVGNITSLTSNLSSNNLTSGVINSITSLGTPYLNNTGGQNLPGVIGGGIGGGVNNIPGMGSVVNTVTETYKNVVGSSVTAVTQVTSLMSNVGSKIATVGRSIGKMFGL